jgi:nicotinamide mononucleotide adenylyltransferase
MKAFARTNLKGAKVVVVVIAGSKSDADKARNPLTGEERISFMKSSGHANGVEFLVAPNAFKAFEAVRAAGYEPMAVAAGSDRVNEYLSLLDKHFKDKDDRPQKHLKVEGLERDADSEDGVDGEALDKIIEMIEDNDFEEEALTRLISGKLARRAVETGKKKAFAYIVKLEDRPALASKMFDKIAQAMGVQHVG